MEELTGFQQIKAPVFPEQEQLKCPRCESANTKFCYYNNYNLSQPRHYCKNCRRYWTKGGTLRNIPVGGGTRKNAKRSSSLDDNNHPKRQPSLAPDPSPQPPTPTPSTIPQKVLLGSAVQNSVSDTDQTRMYVLSLDHRERNMMDGGGSFSSLLASTGQFGSLLNGLNTNGSGSKTAHVDDFRWNLASGRGTGPGSDQDPRLRESNNSNEETEESCVGVHGKDGGDGDRDTNCWTGSSNGWPNLAIYTPDSNFH